MDENRKVLLKLENVKMHFPLKKRDIFDREERSVKAVDGVNIDIYEGETLGLVGESGCGKSTLGRVLLQLYNQTAGSIYYGKVTYDTYAPNYAKGIYSKLTSIKLEEPEKMMEKYRDSVRVAGGLLTSSNLSEVQSILMQKHEIVAKLNSADKQVQLLEVKYAAVTDESSADKDKAKASDVKGQLQQAIKAREAAQDEVEKINSRIAEMKNGLKGNKWFEELEAMQDSSIDLGRLNDEEMRVLRKDLQMVFQDPYSSLNPRLTVGQLISEAVVAHNMFKRGTKQTENYILDIMDKCGLQPYMIHRYPHQFSGGQRQRIGIARSLALKPKFVVCDEAVSALDVSIQSQIINLLMDLKDQEKLTYLFISHDLSAVKFISDRIGVMYLGNIIELGESKDIFYESLHPYTKALIEAIPTTDEESNKTLQVLEGDIPSPINPPSGCKFHTRCKYATDECSKVTPQWQEWRKGHFVACHHPLLEKTV